MFDTVRMCLTPFASSRAAANLRAAADAERSGDGAGFAWARTRRPAGGSEARRRISASRSRGETGRRGQWGAGVGRGREASGAWRRRDSTKNGLQFHRTTRQCISTDAFYFLFFVYLFICISFYFYFFFFLFYCIVIICFFFRLILFYLLNIYLICSLFFIIFFYYFHFIFFTYF